LEQSDEAGRFVYECCGRMTASQAMDSHNGVVFIAPMLLALCRIVETTFDAKEWPAS